MINVAKQSSPAVPPSGREAAGHERDERTSLARAQARSRNPAPAGAAPCSGEPTEAAHWVPPDVLGDILATARRAGAAEPVEIRVRPEIHHRLEHQFSDTAGHDRGSLTDLGGIRLVVDEDLPAFPGYEIHRMLTAPRPRASRPARSDSGFDAANGPPAA